jgi:CO/xanthine dehydrogenase Mo-binding subunit
VTVNASRGVTAGSMRGYGTLQSMTATELLVDEIAGDLGVDAIELRRRNVLKSGMKNTQGAIPAGMLRADEILAEAAQEPLWTERDGRKAEYEAANPGVLYGVGFACVHKDYGTGAEAAMVQIELAPDGHIHMRHVASEIGCGSTTAQMLVPAEHLGRPADTVDFAVIDWPTLPLTSTDEPYTMSQEDEDRNAANPHWVPRITSPRSASNSAYYFSHATREAARLLFDLGLWDAAVSIWSEGIGGGHARPLTVRREQAEWRGG